jgi:hypothetical protein
MGKDGEWSGRGGRASEQGGAGNREGRGTGRALRVIGRAETRGEWGGGERMGSLGQTAFSLDLKFWCSHSILSSALLG